MVSYQQLDFLSGLMESVLLLLLIYQSQQLHCKSNYTCFVAGAGLVVAVASATAPVALELESIGISWASTSWWLLMTPKTTRSSIRHPLRVQLPGGLSTEKIWIQTMTSEDAADNFGQSSFQICILCSGCVNFRFDMKKAAVTVTKRLFIILFQIALR